MTSGVVVFIVYSIATVGVITFLTLIIRNKEPLHALVQTAVGKTFSLDDPKIILAGSLFIGGLLWIFILAIAIGRPIPVRLAVVCPSGTILASGVCYPIQPGLFTFTFELQDHFVWPGTYHSEVEVKSGSIWIAHDDKYLFGHRYLAGESQALYPNDGVWAGGGTVQMRIY